jgi:hypothetical protein
MGRNRSNATAPAVKGNLVAGTGADTSGLLTVGANDTVLTADSTTATGLKWAAPAGGGANWTLINSGGTSLSGTTTTISGISGADKIMILVSGASYNDASFSLFTFRFNTDSGSNYSNNGGISIAESDTASQVDAIGETRANVIFARGSGASSIASGYCLLTGCNSSGVKVYTAGGGSNKSGFNSGQKAYTVGGFYNSSSTISSVSVFCDGASFDAGTVFVYTSA